jgi:hypothetical protein
MLQYQEQSHNRSSNQLLIPHAESVLDQMKQEIARQLGIKLGPEATARANGSVGGEITKRLVALARQNLSQQKRVLH